MDYSRARQLADEIREQEKRLSGLKSELAQLLKDFPSKDVTDVENVPNIGQAATLQTEWPLSNEEYRRYGRQLILPEVGLAGQIQIRDASVLVVGVGGLGCPAAAYLAGAGVGTIGLMDGDTVELSNLHRQILHSTQGIGQLKVESARQRLVSINPQLTYRLHPEHLNPSKSIEIFKNYDLILDCTDHPTSRYLISDAAVLSGKPLVSASALRLHGQLLVLNSPASEPGQGTGGPCYRCVFPKPPPADTVLSCGEGGILGPVVGTMGVLQAVEALKILLKPKNEESNSLDLAGGTSQLNPFSMLIYSAFANPPFRTLRLRGKRLDCPACGKDQTIQKDSLTSGSLDYAVFCGVTTPVELLKSDERISASEYSTMRDDGKPHVLIDVRDETQYGLCKLDNSINIPFAKFASAGGSSKEAFLESLGESTREKLSRGDLYFICRYGNDSQVAVKRMKEAGYGNTEDIKDVKGGFNSWRQEVDSSWPEY